ncbi:MAG: RHS repeat-associated core domain-containing protein, partial [Actinomycetota bacterium]|nr:RHS repeat-associated core domain-containing protein [Actinomycetota bacterium]
LDAARSDTATWSLEYLYDEKGTITGGIYSAEDTSCAFLVVATDRGDVRELLDADGAAFAFYSYDAYGNPDETLSRGTALVPAGLAANISQRNVLRYAGYCYDEASGLYYLSQRYYDPASASFISKDPARADGEESAYQYCAGDPVGKVDPTGEAAHRYVNGKEKWGNAGPWYSFLAAYATVGRVADWLVTMFRTGTEIEALAFKRRWKKIYRTKVDQVWRPRYGEWTNTGHKKYVHTDLAYQEKFVVIRVSRYGRTSWPNKVIKTKWVRYSTAGSKRPRKPSGYPYPSL